MDMIKNVVMRRTVLMKMMILIKSCVATETTMEIKRYRSNLNINTINSFMHNSENMLSPPTTAGVAPVAPVASHPEITADPAKPKRGRKSKKQLINSVTFFDNGNIQNHVDNQPNQPNQPNASNSNNEISTASTTDGVKKRGRKPKGGKIVTENTPAAPTFITKPNIILHLKCSLADLNISQHSEVEGYDIKHGISSELFSLTKDNTTNNMMNTMNTLNYRDELSSETDPDNSDNIDTVSNMPNGSCMTTNAVDKYKKRTCKKIKELEQMLHMNNAFDQKSACFWCTCAYDNASIYIPKCCISGVYHVYGCFCTPECGVAYLMNEHIDVSAKFERYHLMNYIYKKAFEYSNNIKPAPNPHYLLDKFCGNLSSLEYRSLFEDDRLFLISDKPMTRIFPELHEDSNDFILNRKIIQSNAYKIKPQSANKYVANKTTIVHDNFKISS